MTLLKKIKCHKNQPIVEVSTAQLGRANIHEETMGPSGTITLHKFIEHQTCGVLQQPCGKQLSSSIELALLDSAELWELLLSTTSPVEGRGSDDLQQETNALCALELDYP